MTIEELKQEIEQRTGVSACLLNGETAEENIAQAKAVLAYKKEHEAQRTKTAAEQFGAWFNALQGIEAPDAAGEALADIEKTARAEAGKYPITRDGGEVTGLPDPRSARDQFVEWFDNITAYDPVRK